MTGALNKPLRWIVGAGALALLLIAFTAGSARAASYPNNGSGSTFSGSAEGWKASGKCNLELLLCTSTAKYDGASGAGPGSLISETTVLASLLTLFHAEFAFESPSFTVGSDGGGQATVSLQRAFDPKALVKLAPELKYTVTLVDKTSGTSQVALAEATQAESAYLTKSGNVTLVAGHTYSVLIGGEVGATVVEALTLGGTTSVNFDNVLVSGPGTNGPGSGSGGNGGNGGNGSDGGNGGGSLTDSRLLGLVQSSMAGSATVKGNRVFIKANCPAAVGAACKVTVQGFLKKGKPATAPRTAKIAKGKSKQLVLKIKPKVKKKVAKRKRLLFKQTVKAASAKATVYKSLKLIRR